jgi:hypothetical protein
MPSGLDGGLRSPLFLLLLILAASGTILGAVAITMQLTKSAEVSGLPRLFSDSFSVGSGQDCRPPVSPEPLGPCSLFNFTIPGPTGGYRLVYATFALNATCYDSCGYVVGSWTQNGTSALPFSFGDTLNRTQVGSGVLTPGSGYVKVSQALSVCDPANKTCINWPIEFNVVVYDLGEINY